MIAFIKTTTANPVPFFDLQVDGPSLLRVNRMFTNAGVAILSPTTGGFITLAAWPMEERPIGASEDQRAIRAWRGTGPLIFLPHKGRWQVVLDISTLGGALLPAIFKAELSLAQLPLEIAAAYIQSPPSSFHVSGNFSVAAGAGFNVFSPSGVDLTTLSGPSWHLLTRFVIRMNTTPAADFRVAIGRTASAGAGAILGGLASRAWEWQEIAGQTVFVFNNTLGAFDVSIEAHFL